MDAIVADGHSKVLMKTKVGHPSRVFLFLKYPEGKKRERGKNVVAAKKKRRTGNRAVTQKSST